ncbi:MAG: SLC13 family permease [Phycisphaeraceae bacterium]
MNAIVLVLIGMLVVIAAIVVLKLHAFLALILAAILVAALTPGDALVAAKVADQTIGSRIATGFGKTCASVGILIAMAAVVGQCLLRSGAAERIVNSALATVGEKRAPIAFTFSGFLLAIPVFFDTVFLLLIPLGKELRIKTGKNYTLYVMSIVAGATMAHSLVPPTPGPLLAASQLNVEVGTMMLGGTIVGLFTVSAGLCYAYWLNKRLEIPLRDVEGGERVVDTEVRPSPGPSPGPSLRGRGVERVLPPMWFALLPIALPVVLIATSSILSQAFDGVKADDLPAWWVAIEPALNFVGDKNIAITIAAGLALLMMLQYGHSDAKGMRAGVQKALESGGVIILITAAGGAFGAILQQTGIADEFKRMAPDGSLGLWLIPLAYGVTALVRTAQGSATVAMITAAGIVGPIVVPLAAAGTLGFHPVYMALAIACGSKPISWMNDSGFWVIGKMSGMTEGETFKTSSMIMIVMSVTGLIVVTLGAWLLPLA